MQQLSARFLYLLIFAGVLAAGGSNQTTPFPVVPRQPAGKPHALDGDFYDDYQLQEAGYHAGLYAGAAGQFNPYAAGYHQGYDDDYFMPADTAARLLAECEGKENGAPLNKSRACEVRISGADAVVLNLAGGIDGVYRPVACNDGRPMYLRQGSPPYEDRVLWWSNKFSDWDLANGSRPQEDLLMFGGSAAEVRPQHVLSWHLATEFQPNASAVQDYAPANVTVVCNNVTAAPSGTLVVVPGKGTKQRKEGGAAAAAGTTPGPQASAPAPGGPQPGQGAAQQPAQNTSAPVTGQQQQQRRQGAASDSGGGGGEPTPPAGTPSLGGGEDWPGEGDLDDYADDEALGGVGWHEALSAEAAAAAAAQELKGPLLTDDEIEQQYSLVYKRAASARAQSAAADSVLAGVFLLGAVGIAVGLPALTYARRRRARNGAAHPEGAAVYISLSQAVRGRRAPKAVQQE